MKIRVRFAAVGLCALSVLGGCALEVDTEAQDDAEVASAQQALNRSWGPLDRLGYIVGMATKSRYYAWYAPAGYSTRGEVCSGTSDTRLRDSCKTFVAPDNVWDIRGVGIAKNSSHVYTWYRESNGSGRYSQGTSTNLSAYHGKKSFTRPTIPGRRDKLFDMDALVGVDNSPNGYWYYYWYNSYDGNLYRTTGYSNDSTAHTGTEIVSVRKSSWPVEIAFRDDGKIQTYYYDGITNISSNSRDLAQP